MKASCSTSFAAALMSAVLLLPAAAPAGFIDNPPPQPGFSHQERIGQEPAARHGVFTSGEAIFRSSPVIAEIDGNPANGKEVAVGGQDGMVYVYRSNGTLLWERNAMRQPCSWGSGDAALHSAPAVGEIHGDGVPYVVIGYGTILPSACDGGVAAYRGDTGALAWRYSLVDNPETTAEQNHGVLSSPALADTDGDGTMEVGFGSFSRYVYLLNHDGTVRMRAHTADTVWSSPAFADIDDDLRLEMVIGSDISANADLRPPTSDGGYVYAFDTEQRTPVDLGFRQGQKWMTYLDQTVFSSPAIGDILPDVPGLEIAIGSGSYFPEGSTQKRGKWVKILRAADGAVLKTLDAPACVRSSPALADIDSDGLIEVVAISAGEASVGGDGFSRVIAWEPSDGSRKWATVVRDPTQAGHDGNGDLQSPVIADVDGNGSLEVLVSNFSSVHILRARDGYPLTCQSNTCGSQISLYAWGWLQGTPAVGDLDGDGDMEVVIGGTHQGNGRRGTVYAWTNLSGAGLGSPAESRTRGASPWPMFRADATHRARLLVPPRLAAIPGALRLFHQAGAGGSEMAGIQVLNGGDLGFNWTATAGRPDLVGLSAASGSVVKRAALQVTVDTRAYDGTPGTYDLGYIVLEGRTEEAAAVEGSPLSIPVTLTVGGEVRRIFVPGVVK